MMLRLAGHAAFADLEHVTKAGSSRMRLGKEYLDLGAPRIVPAEIGTRGIPRLAGVLGFSLFLRSRGGSGPASAFSGSRGDHGVQVGGVVVVAAGAAGRRSDQMVAGRVQDRGEGDPVGVYAEVDRGGHGVIDEGVV